MEDLGLRPCIRTFSLIIGLSILASCGGGGSSGSTSRGTDNVIKVTVAPTGVFLGYTGEAQSLDITFTTSDGASASALSVSGLNTLPVGWASSTGGTCASVAPGNGCTLTLTYTPPAPESGTVTLTFSYKANDGTPKTGTVSIPFAARSIALHLLAGSAGGAGNLDGVGSVARFDGPMAVVADNAGNVYVADGNGLIRKITPDHRVTTILGSSLGDIAVEPGANFTGLAIDTSNNLYIADYAESTILKFTPAGVLTTLAGSAGKLGAADGMGANATFNYPTALAVNAAGTVFVADKLNNEIRQISPEGVVTTLAGSIQKGSTDGIGAAAGFWYPSGIAVDAAGTVYVADTENNTIRKITPQGTVSTLAGIVGDFAWADGQGTSAAFDFPRGMSIDSANNLYVTDNVGLIRKITPQGVVTTPLGTPGKFGSADGTGAGASFQFPADVAAVPGGVLYVADFGNNAIRMASSQDVVTTIAGLPNPYLGPAPSLGFASGITADAAGNIYVAQGNIVKISPQGDVSIIGLQTPLFNTIVGIAVGTDGTMYVSAGAIVQKVSPQGVVTDLGGSPDAFNTTAGIVVNNEGTVYVADSGNNLIRAITPQGVISTLAGNAAFCCDSLDGTGANAHFRIPFSLALDNAGNLYVGEWQGTIRKVTPQGVVTTLPIASAGLSFNAGTGTSNLAFDKSNNLYVADEYNQIIRKITPQNIVTTVIGDPAHVGIALAPLPASLADPQGVVVLPSGQLAILDGSAVLVTQGL